MKNLLNESVFSVKTEIYLTLLIFIAPLLNFLSGITFDLYTPSLPALANYYAVSMLIVKNTVTATLIGFALGCLIGGVLLDVFGRRRIILLSLLLYTLVSLMAIVCHSIEQLMLVRFLQGLLVAAVSIGCRTIVIDSFTGHRYTVALLYTSLAYGLGPIIGPFIGGILQYHFGWKLNFLAYAFLALLLFLVFTLYVKESIALRQTFSLKRISKSYVTVIKHPIFMAAIVIVGCCQVELLLYSTVGSFIVENTLHRSAIVYGNTALLVGCCYLIGTMTNRVFIKRFHLHHLTHFGFLLMMIAVLTQISLACFSKLSLLTVIAPIMLICYGHGFIIPNIFVRSLKIFPGQAGIATAALTCLAIALTAIGMFIVSHINANSLANLAAIFAVLLTLQLAVFYGSGVSRLEAK